MGRTLELPKCLRAAGVTEAMSKLSKMSKSKGYQAVELITDPKHSLKTKRNWYLFQMMVLAAQMAEQHLHSMPSNQTPPLLGITGAPKESTCREFYQTSRPTFSNMEALKFPSQHGTLFSEGLSHHSSH